MVGRQTHSYDVVVIGAGSGGLTAASGFRKIGKRVLLVEREHMGGECTNFGCIPSKALLHHAKAFHAAHRLTGDSQSLASYRNEAFTYVRSVVDEVLAHETPDIFRQRGIDVVFGEAEFVTPCSIAVDSTEYTYKNAVIATGSRPRRLDILGIEDKDVLTNENLFDLTSIPERLLIVGGGPIGLEMGQALAMLGSQVTIVDVNDRFAHLEDPAISPLMQQTFANLGVTIHLNATVAEATNKIATVEIKNDTDKADVSRQQVMYDKVLFAVGRVPNFPQGLDVAGIKASDRCIQVDSQYRTSNQYVYAVGDVTQRLKFTHTADDTARQVVKRVASRGLLRVKKQKAVPKVTYTEPEIAQVGLSHEAALTKYSEEEIMRVEVSFSEVDRATTDGTSGLAVVTARRLTGAVLGANIFGPRAGELITPFTLAIDQKISLWRLQSTIYAYPTYSLIIKKVADTFVAEQLTSLKQDILALLKRQAPKLIALVFWISLIVWFQHYKVSNSLSYQDLALQLYEFFTGTMYGPLVYIVLYAIRPLIFFPATLLTALSGALFGLWGGIIYTVIGENLSANFAYWIGRFFGNDWKLEDSPIGNWIEALRNRPFESVLFMRLFYFPFDFTNYASGILKVKWVAYALATVIGIMPGLTVFVALGASVNIERFKMDGITFDAFDPRFIALSVAIFIISVLLSRLLKRWKAAE